MRPLHLLATLGVLALIAVPSPFALARPSDFEAAGEAWDRWYSSASECENPLLGAARVTIDNHTGTGEIDVVGSCVRYVHRFPHGTCMRWRDDVACLVPGATEDRMNLDVQGLRATLEFSYRHPNGRLDTVTGFLVVLVGGR